MKDRKTIKCLLILGCGYVGKKLAQACLKNDIQVKATTRSLEHQHKLQKLGLDTKQTHDPSTLEASWLQDCDAVLDSIPLAYSEDKTPYQTQSQWVGPLLAKMPNLVWSAYLSATSVYTDSGGAWVSEGSPTNPSNQRGIQRLAAEQAWLNSSKSIEIFRLSGIYGHERNILDKLFDGEYQTVQWQPEHYSNRIHVDDIVRSIIAAISAPKPGRMLNLSDDEPCSHAIYTTTLAARIGAPSPTILNPEQAVAQMSTAYLDFFRDNKRISNQKLHRELLPQLKYPSFRDAIDDLLDAYGGKK